MPNTFKSELHQLVLDRICHWWVLVHTSCPCDILQNQPTLEGLNLSSAWVQPFSKEQHFPVQKQAAGTLPTACLSEKGILSLLSPGVVSEPHHWHCPACLGCRGVLTALGTHCCLVTALESHWMTFCIPSLSFFLPCSPLGSYKSTRVLLNLIFHTEGFYLTGFITQKDIYPSVHWSWHASSRNEAEEGKGSKHSALTLKTFDKDPWSLPHKAKFCAEWVKRIQMILFAFTTHLWRAMFQMQLRGLGPVF